MNQARPDGMPEGAKPCEKCGEWIRRPVPRAGGGIFCTDCVADAGGAAPEYNHDKGWLADNSYHGGRGHSAEW